MKKKYNRSCSLRSSSSFNSNINLEVPSKVELILDLIEGDEVDLKE